MACPFWQQQAIASATTDNHSLLKKPHLFFWDIHKMKDKSSSHSTRLPPTSHSYYVKPQWEKNTSIFLQCSPAPFPQQRDFSWQELHVSLQTLHIGKSHGESMTTALLFASCYILQPRSWAENQAGFFFFYNTKDFTFFTLNNTTVYHPLHIIISPLLCIKHIQISKEHS